MPTFDNVYHEAVTIPGDRIVPKEEECRAMYDFLKGRWEEDAVLEEKLDAIEGELETLTDTCENLNDELFEVKYDLAISRFFEGVYREIYGR